jgi:Leucine-rich repeat (LRR) protein
LIDANRVINSNPSKRGKVSELLIKNYKENQQWLKDLGIDWEGPISGIKILNLAAMGITSLPESIEQLTSLERLILYRNSLTSLPKEICNLHALEFLELDNNKLDLLPELIGQLTNLKRLDLSMNQLTTLPRSIMGLGRLETLNVRENPLLGEEFEILKFMKGMSLLSGRDFKWIYK